ncbi:MAG TPA: SpoIID/LytB domain-containing protein [Candidatus Limnocylindrales bacterium]|nr:SpoIID/LytB domain-containing protein [Candidatus Limnocylindrales bacterium]
MRIAPAMLAFIASVLFVFSSFFVAVPSVAASAGLNQCTPATTSQPPSTIAVYRVATGRVQRVDFKLYVARVTYHEWNVDATALRRAGAVAAKQYAWYHVLNWRGGRAGGECFDVRDSTADQIYQAKSARSIPARIFKSVNDTWSWRMNRDGRFFMSGYRTGTVAPCASDAGSKLYARSAKRCAKKGWSTERILRTYYTANVTK